MDDNAGWEIGSIDTPEKVTINGKQVAMKDYKLPIVVDVSITLKLLESKGTTEGKQFYGFGRLGANNSVTPTDTGGASSANVQKSGDSNISVDSTKIESSETFKNDNVKTLNGREANKETDGNKSSNSIYAKFTGFGGGSFGGGGAGGSF
jgi:hypothetical protein